MVLAANLLSVLLNLGGQGAYVWYFTRKRWLEAPTDEKPMLGNQALST